MIKRTPHEGQPILPAAASFKTGVRGGPEQVTDVLKEDAAVKNISDLYLYPNVVRALRVTGRQIRAWLGRSAALFLWVATGEQDVVFSNLSFPRCNFDVIDGANYRIDLSQPSKYDPRSGLWDVDVNRTLGLIYNDVPLDLSAESIIATNNSGVGGGALSRGIIWHCRVRRSRYKLWCHWALCN